jgi:hypothetical protein
MRWLRCEESLGLPSISGATARRPPSASATGRAFCIECPTVCLQPQIPINGGSSYPRVAQWCRPGSTRKTNYDNSNTNPSLVVTVPRESKW